MASRKKTPGGDMKAEMKATPKKGKAEDIPSRQERAEAFLNAFNKSMKGRAVVKKASEYTLPYMTKRLPTGLLTLDRELRGGFPAGGLSQIAGPKNSGKSWICWQVIRQLQNILGDKLMVLLAMTEMRADREQARSAGVQIALADEDIEALERARVKNGWPPFTPDEVADMKHEVGTFHELHGESAEDLYDGILAGVEVGLYHLIIIDSFGNIMSGAEAEADSLTEKTYAGASQVNTKFLRKLAALLTMDDQYGRARDVCILGINQIRDAIGDPNREFKSPGGKALEHAKFVDLVVQSGKQVGFEAPMMTADGTKKRWVQTGKEVNWKIEKGKAGIHEGGRGSYVYDFRINTANFYLDTFVAGVQDGLIQMAGAWASLHGPNGEVLLRANGKDAFIEGLVADAQAKEASGDPHTLMNYIRDLVFRKADISVDYYWEP
jgi:RecA/RadA recombinase